MRYWIKIGDRAQGPMDARELMSFPNIEGTSLVSREDSPGVWFELGAIPELDLLFEMRGSLSRRDTGGFLRTRLHRAEAEVRRLHEKLRDARREAASSRRAGHAAERKSRLAGSEVDSLRRIHHGLEAELADLKAENRELKEREPLIRAEETIAADMRADKDLKKKLFRAQGVETELRTAVTELEAKLSEVRTAFGAELRAKLQAGEARAAELEGEVRLQSSRARSAEELLSEETERSAARLESIGKRLERDVQDALRERGEETDRRKAAEEKLRNEEKTAENLSRNLDSLRSTHIRKEAEIEKLEARVGDAVMISKRLQEANEAVARAASPPVRSGASSAAEPIIPDEPGAEPASVRAPRLDLGTAALWAAIAVLFLLTGWILLTRDIPSEPPPTHSERPLVPSRAGPQPPASVPEPPPAEPNGIEPPAAPPVRPVPPQKAAKPRQRVQESNRPTSEIGDLLQPELMPGM